MDTGRNRGYHNECRENGTDFDVSKKKISYSKAEYESLKNDNNKDHERGRNRARDVRERELGNSDGYYSVRVGDREPGELSSDSGSDEALDLEIHGKSNNGSKIEELSHSHSLSKKRKFSPIVWEKNDNELSNIFKDSKSRFSTENTDLPVSKSYKQSPYSIHPSVEQISTLENDKIQTIECSPGNTPFGLSFHKERVGLSSSPAQEENFECVQKAGKPEDEDYLPPARNIRSSRWANDAVSPVNDGEISDALGNNGIQRKRKEFNPDIGELCKEGSEGTRERSNDSYENGYHIRSSSSDDDFEKDDNIPSVSQSYTVSESDDGSHGTPQHVFPPQRSVNMLQGCRSVDEFERLNKIDEGTYGVVFRAKDKKTEEIVALKKVKMEKEREGFPLTSLREINILLSFHHPSVVDVKEVVVGSNLDSIFMVMEYMEHDLKALMETMKQPFSQSEVKCLMLQLLEGTKYLHENWVLHRDLKTSNLLLNNRGELKICDFGLSRQYGSPLKSYTHLVVTLWYRAPELLLGANQYSTAIDMWSLGCIMAELLSKQPLFNGKTEFDQLDKIFKTLGTPNETIWPGFSKLPRVKLNFVKHQYNLLRRKFPATSFIGSPILSDAGFDLLNKLLTYNPEKRVTAEAALNHEWFREVPLPKSKDFMPTFPAHHAQDRRTRRVMKSPDPLEKQRRKELHQAKLETGSFIDIAGEILHSDIALWGNFLLKIDYVTTSNLCIVVGVAWKRHP